MHERSAKLNSANVYCVYLRKVSTQIGSPNYNPPIKSKNRYMYMYSAKYNSRQYFHAIHFMPYGICHLQL